jgi:hypothetical protein
MYCADVGSPPLSGVYANHPGTMKSFAAWLWLRRPERERGEKGAQMIDAVRPRPPSMLPFPSMGFSEEKRKLIGNLLRKDLITNQADSMRCALTGHTT